ncbi:basic salivary proline-rich protein 4-like [Phyllostomus discolor]|uniref:Basic salivary proline-rich protein 4-like n=1 Tax=Phyllostomus discolor TaxID=89673 RepID=A0A7E6E3J1_9CHIR|nr:basic salivary proline-rich protein 4-like [Phyllostomus discolor]
MLSPRVLLDPRPLEKQGPPAPGTARAPRCCVCLGKHREPARGSPGRGGELGEVTTGGALVCLLPGVFLRPLFGVLNCDPQDSAPLLTLALLREGPRGGSSRFAPRPPPRPPFREERPPGTRQVRPWRGSQVGSRRAPPPSRRERPPVRVAVRDSRDPRGGARSALPPRFPRPVAAPLPLGWTSGPGEPASRRRRAAWVRRRRSGQRSLARGPAALPQTCPPRRSVLRSPGAGRAENHRAQPRGRTSHPGVGGGVRRAGGWRWEIRDQGGARRQVPLIRGRGASAGRAPAEFRAAEGPVCGRGRSA